MGRNASRRAHSQNKEAAQWKYASLLIWCCCNIPDGRNMLAMQHGTAVEKSSRTFLMTRNNTIGNEIACGVSPRQTELNQERLLKKSNEMILNELNE